MVQRMGPATTARVTAGRSLCGLVLVVSVASITPGRAALSAGVPRGGAGLVSASGAVGPLRIDHSTPVQIQAFAGAAEYIGAGRFRPLIHEFAPFIAFGYGCRHVRSGGIPTMTFDRKTGAPGDSHVDCRTVYFVNQRTGSFAGFSTTSRRFHTAAGVRPGTSLADAKRREHRPTLMDNPPALSVRTANADLLIYASIIIPKHGDWHVGKTVAALELESRRHMIGLEFV
jgi:hypothetical protein